MQKRRNSSALALELRLFCIMPSISSVAHLDPCGCRMICVEFVLSSDFHKYYIFTHCRLRDDRADRFERLFLARKKLEEDWRGAYSMKRNRETEERSAARSPGQLLHEQCDRYKRCGQCKRNLVNCGESNIWRESRYIPGSRLMV